ncbi:MAG: hypothetical protein FJZ89_00505 [Chloroflexi bacterium]|nr:hypothetical protein [Chloroflexota bacterium]
MVRGGSFNNNQRNVRCAYRNRNNPDNFNRNIGFRLVVSHGFRGVSRKCRAARASRPRKKLAWPVPGREAGISRLRANREAGCPLALRLGQP